ncbi:pentapeptide repeat-containing protein [Streptomyces sp. NPDC052693]|uniref:pentapeptide repeat-containing protein n=1 Tax=Streptomyces sp. NPDC052693 TaxID=3155814 RepID=UPI003423FBD2
MTANRRPRPTSNDWELRRALTVTFAAAILVAGGVFYGLVYLLDFQEIDSTAKLDAKTLFDLVKLSFGVVAGAGALVALVVAYRRQHVDEAGARREATRLHTERFSQAVEQLGSDSPATQLGGVHALAGLADDAPTQDLRQTCIDVLCAYLQLPFIPDPGDDPDHQEEHHRYLALRKVRHTILRLISDHYRRPQGTHRSWQGCALDLTDVIIDGPMDFYGATFSGGKVSFEGATFSGGRVSFDGSTFSGLVSFTGARFSGGTVSFESVFFGGRVSFGNAVFSGSTVPFYGAVFSGDTVFFGGAVFSGGSVRFDDVAGPPPPRASPCRRHSCSCGGHPSPRLAALESIARGGGNGRRRPRHVGRVAFERRDGRMSAAQHSSVRRQATSRVLLPCFGVLADGGGNIEQCVSDGRQPLADSRGPPLFLSPTLRTLGQLVRPVPIAAWLRHECAILSRRAFRQPLLPPQWDGT